jgi:hypothetical protein
MMGKRAFAKLEAKGLWIRNHSQWIFLTSSIRSENIEIFQPLANGESMALEVLRESRVGVCRLRSLASIFDHGSGIQQCQRRLAA